MQVDKFLTPDDFNKVRGEALSSEYGDWKDKNGIVYKRICTVDIPEVSARLTQEYGDVDVLGMAFRADMEGHRTTQPIHTDIGWGTHALVLYLNDGDSGTAFWKHRDSGRIEMSMRDIHSYIDTRKDWGTEDKWEIYDEVQMKANRAALYRSELFHSRWPFDGFGTCLEDCRLVLVAFFTPRIMPEELNGGMLFN